MQKSCGNCAVIFWWRKNVEKKAVEKAENTLKKTYVSLLHPLEKKIRNPFEEM